MIGMEIDYSNLKQIATKKVGDWIIPQERRVIDNYIIRAEQCQLATNSKH